MPPQTLQYAFLDESGILEKKSKTGRYFVIVVLVIFHAATLKKVMKHARRSVHAAYKMHRIFKASKENENFVKRVLQEIAKQDCKIIIGIWDKRDKSPYKEKNVLYAQLLAATIDTALAYYQKLHIVMHKRYTNPQVRQQVNTILSTHVKKGVFVSLEHRSERECKELELVDAVAWAVYQKYNNKRLEFYNIIKKSIINENRLAT